MTSQKQSIAIRGAGVVGLWQALTLARAGHAVTIYERSATPFTDACSVFAGAMLAPRCEEDRAETLIGKLGARGITLWQATYPGMVANGTVVTALNRDRAELDRFARLTEGHRRLSAEDLARLEPALTGRFAGALYYPDEAHLATEAALHFLLHQVREAGVTLRFGESEVAKGKDFVIDCRGLAARDALPTLRGVRGERI